MDEHTLAAACPEDGGEQDAGVKAGEDVTKPEGMNLRAHAAAGDRAGETGPDGASWDKAIPFEEVRPGRKTGRRLAKPNIPGGSPMVTMSEEKLYLTRREAAALARVSTWTLDEWMREEDFPVLRLGERTRIIPKQEFLEWLPRYAARRGNPNPIQPSPTPRRRKR